MRALIGLTGLLLVLIAVVSCSGKQPCSSANCGTCCAADVCVSATSDMQCGAAGNVCKACGSGFACKAGLCERSSSGGGAGGGTGGTGGGTAGGSAGGGAGASGGGSGGASGGSAGGTGGAAGGSVTCGTPPSTPTIPITFPANCPRPTPCGGNPSGTFHYTGACISQSEFSGFVSEIERRGCGVGSVQLTGFDGGMSGYATFGAGTVCRKVDGNVVVAATVTGLCGADLICNALNGNMMGFQAQCSPDAGSCFCNVARTIAINNAAHYTTAANSLTITETGQTFETCLTGGNTFSTFELDAGSGGLAAHEPGVATLTKP